MHRWRVDGHNERNRCFSQLCKHASEVILLRFQFTVVLQTGPNPLSTTNFYYSINTSLPPVLCAAIATQRHGMHFTLMQNHTTDVTYPATNGACAEHFSGSI